MRRLKRCRTQHLSLAQRTIFFIIRESCKERFTTKSSSLYHDIHIINKHNYLLNQYWTVLLSLMLVNRLMSREVAIVLELCLPRHRPAMHPLSTPQMLLQMSVCPHSQQPNSRMILLHCFTCLGNYQKFMWVLCTPNQAAYHLTYMYGTASDSISVPDRFVLVLIKLRKHYSNSELSRLFDVSQATVYNIFCTWLKTFLTSDIIFYCFQLCNFRCGMVPPDA